jgi:hypothetical protein
MLWILSSNEVSKGSCLALLIRPPSCCSGRVGKSGGCLPELVEDNVQILGGLDPASGSLLVRNILQQYNQLERVTVDDLQCLKKILSLLDRHPLAMKSIIGGGTINDA